MLLSYMAKVRQSRRSLQMGNARPIRKRFHTLHPLYTFFPTLLPSRYTPHHVVTATADHAAFTDPSLAFLLTSLQEAFSQDQ